MSECVLVTEPEYLKGEDVLAAVEDLELVRIGVDEQVLADTILARGVRAVIVGQARARGIVVTNTPGTLDASVAEHVFRRLARLRPTAWLINTSRGSVVDESALYDALQAGRISGAALDVFQAEPYLPVAPDKDQRQLDNVILTPHVGSNTREANRRMAQAGLANVRAFLAGRLDRLTRVD